MTAMIFSLVLPFLIAGFEFPLILSGHTSAQDEFSITPHCLRCIPTCNLVVNPAGFIQSAPNCPGASNGLILFDENYVQNGTPPYSFDWDNLSTPYNDVFSDDGYFVLDSLSAGTYALIVTDAQGCSASASTMEEDPVIYATTLVDSVGLCKFTGGIQITSFVGPPYFLNYNWDFASTPYDDDYGSGQYYMGFPPASNDQEDISEGLEGGTYFLEITVVYDSMFMELNCIWRDTFNIFIDSLRLICPSGDAYVYAGDPDTTTTYQWQIDSLNGFEDVHPDAHHAGTAGPLLYLTEMPSTWYGHQYRCRLIQGVDTIFSVPFILKFGLCSDGSPTIWGLASSWHCNSVPDAYSDVFITELGGTTSVHSNARCRSLTLLPGGRLRIYPPSLLIIDPDP